MIYYKKLDDAATAQDGVYALIERQWPATLDENTLETTLEITLENIHQKDHVKNKLTQDNWYPDAAPSMALYQWIQQTQTDSMSDQQQQEQEFRQRYRQELIAHPEYWMSLLDKARNANLTLVFVGDSKLVNYSLINHTNILAEFLEDELDRFNDASSPVCYAHLNKLD